MKTMFQKTIRPLFCLWLFPILIQLLDANVFITVNATEPTLVTSFSSETLVTSSTYQLFENDEWLLSLGGNNNGVGASSLHASKFALGSYSYLMSFDQSFSSGTRYVVSLIGKTLLTDVNQISISRGPSNYNYGGVKAYLVRSTNLMSDYELVTTIDEITTVSINYSFDINSDPSYYALVFYNPSGVFLLGNVNIGFYCQTPSITYSRITELSQLYYGATYTLVCEESNKVIHYDEKTDTLNALPMLVTNSQIVDNDTLLKFKLGIGELIDNYSLQLLSSTKEGYYLSSSIDYRLITNSITSKSESFGVRFNLGLVEVTNIDGNVLRFDNNENQFIFSTNSNLSLYRLDTSINHEEEVSVFTQVVLTKGENASGHCEEVYLYLNSAYSRLSEEGKKIFMSSIDTNDIKAKERLTYLSTWSSNNHYYKSNSLQNDNQFYFLFIFTLCASSIGSYVYLKSKKSI